MRRIEELFVPETITTVEGLVDFLVREIEARGGDPATARALETKEAIPNVEFSEEWPCLTFAWESAR